MVLYTAINKKKGGGVLFNECMRVMHATTGVDVHIVSDISYVRMVFFKSRSSATSLSERPFLRRSKTSHDTVAVVVAQMTLKEKYAHTERDRQELGHEDKT